VTSVSPLWQMNPQNLFIELVTYSLNIW